MVKHSATHSEIKLMRTVEGLRSSVIDETAQGKTLTPDKINELTKQQDLDLEVLVRFLRSDEQISPAIRNWIADLCEVKRNTKLVLKSSTTSRPKHSRIRQTMLRRHAARFALKKQTEYGDKKLKRSLSEAALAYGIGTSSIRKELDHIKEFAAFKESVSTR